MDEQQDRIRERAYHLWEDEGCPEGRAEAHWFQAKEIVAVEDGQSATLHPTDTAASSSIEPIEALSNAGEFPTLTDQGEMNIPHRPASGADVAANDEREPVSEIETIHRTLEVPADRRGKASPAGDPTGAMSGISGARLRR